MSGLVVIACKFLKVILHEAIKYELEVEKGDGAVGER
jgi:hypothetical protein